MASITGWLDEWTRKITRSLLSQRQSGDVQSDPDSAVIEFINPERTKGKLPNGQIVDTITKGSVFGKYGIGYRVGKKKYVVYQKPAIVTHVDGGGFTPYVMLISSPAFPSILVFDVKKNLWATVTLPSGFSTNLDVNRMGAGFTPSGRHLIVWGYFSTGDEDLQLVQNVQAKWVYFKNFRIVSDPESLDPSTEGLFESDDPITGTGSLSNGLAQPPSASVPDWDPAIFDTAQLLNGSTEVDFEDDPDFETELNGAFYIGDPPTEAYNPLTADPIYPIRAEYYEYTDNNGAVQPALDLFGSFDLHNQKRNYKRVTEMLSEYENVTPPLNRSRSYTATYGPLVEESQYWGDETRIEDRNTTIVAQSSLGATTYFSNNAPDVVRLYSTPYTTFTNSNFISTEPIDGIGGDTQKWDASDVNATEDKIGSPVQSVNVNVNYENGTGSHILVTSETNVRVKVRTNTNETIFYYQTHNGISDSAISKQTTVDEEGEETVIGTLVEFNITNSQTSFRSKTTPAVSTARALATIGEGSEQSAFLVPGYIATPGTNVQNLLNTALGQVIFSNIFTKDAGVTSLQNVDFIIVLDDLNVITITIVTETVEDETIYKWNFQKWSYNSQTDVFTGGASKRFVIPTEWKEIFDPSTWQTQPPQVFIIRS